MAKVHLHGGLQFDVTETRAQVEQAISQDLNAVGSIMLKTLLFSRVGGGQVRFFTRLVIAVED